jgi:hypothetical protein
MQTIQIKRLDESIPPPTGNPFDLFVWDSVPMLEAGGADCGIHMVETGIEITLPKGYSLRVEGAGDYWCLDSIVLKDVSVRLLILGMGEPKEGEKVGRATIVADDMPAVRFVEMSPSGGRIVRGDAVRADVPFVGKDMSGIQFAAEDKVDEDSC